MAARNPDPFGALRGWKISVRNPPPGHTRYWESVMTLGNGLLGVRGSRSESARSAQALPMTLMAEVYDRPGRKAGEPRKYRRPSRLLALPNALALQFQRNGHGLIDAQSPAAEEQLTLNLQRGTHDREAEFRAATGEITRLTVRRLVSQARPHLVAERLRLQPVNYEGPVTLVLGIDGCAGYDDGLEQHRLVGQGARESMAWYAVRTLQSRVTVALAVAHRLAIGAQPVPAEHRPLPGERRGGLSLTFHARRGATYTIERTVSIHNSLHDADPLAEARAEAAAAPGFADLEREHASEWDQYWETADVRIGGDRVAQTMARFFAFHLLQSASLNNVRLGLSASVPAKSLSGPGYNGHIFWDTEIYMLPFYSLQFPEIAEALLRYRYDRLGTAEANARDCRTRGVKFPWESAGTGAEECPKWVVLKDGTYFRWRGGEQEIHINADVPMGLHRHALATGRSELDHPAAPALAAGTARYWASVARERPGPRGGEYHIRGVIGPDEYHSGVSNSVYTNAMAAWNLRWSAGLLERCRIEQPARYRRFARDSRLTDAEIRRWLRVADGLRINFDPATGLYEQFDGYFAHDSQQIKQADVMLLLYLLPELASPQVLRRNFDRYYPVTTHDSSLSPALHVIFSLDAGRPADAYAYLQRACAVDGSRQGSSSDDGLHSACLGAGWTAIVSGFGGVRVGAEHLEIAPSLPRHWRRLAFRLSYRGARLSLDVTPRRLEVRAEAGGAPAPLRIGGRRVRLRAGRRLVLEGQWQSPPPPPPPRCDAPVRAVIFDLDGVIVSTDEFHYLAWKELADSEGIGFDREINHRLRGVSRMASLDIILERAGKPYTLAQREAMAERKNARYRELLNRLTSRNILPGVLVLLARLRERGVKVAIASSSRNTPRILERTGLAQAFDAVADGSDITRSKPDPEVFLLAARRLGVPPRRCLVVEDAAAGVEGAHAGGMRCLAVGSAAGHALADLSAPDLRSIEVDRLLASGGAQEPA